MCLADPIMFMFVVMVYHLCFSSVLMGGPSIVLPFSFVHVGHLYRTFGLWTCVGMFLSHPQWLHREHVKHKISSPPLLQISHTSS